MDEEGSSVLGDYEEVPEWQDMIDGEEDEIDTGAVGEYARGLGDDIDEEQDGAMEEEDEEEDDDIDGEASIESFLPELEGFDDMRASHQDGWDLEEVLNYDDNFRRGNHIFVNSGSRSTGMFRLCVAFRYILIFVYRLD